MRLGMAREGLVGRTFDEVHGGLCARGRWPPRKDARAIQADKKGPPGGHARHVMSRERPGPWLWLWHYYLPWP